LPLSIWRGPFVPWMIRGLDVVCLVFNEGYAASAGDAHVRRSLCAEALRLAGLVAELMPDEAEAVGLHALLLALDARRDARVDATGAVVLLDDHLLRRLGAREAAAGAYARAIGLTGNAAEFALLERRLAETRA
jgi:RNA polymerase sigma-70 factor (ECF subfamily)